MGHKQWLQEEQHHLLHCFAPSQLCSCKTGRDCNQREKAADLGRECAGVGSNFSSASSPESLPESVNPSGPLRAPQTAEAAQAVPGNGEGEGRDPARLFSASDHWIISASLPAGGVLSRVSPKRTQLALRSWVRGSGGGCLFKAAAKSALRSVTQENPVRVRWIRCCQGQRRRLKTGWSRGKAESG